MEYDHNTIEETNRFGHRLGEVLRGGETIELIGDVGAGKTALTKAIAGGMGITDDVQSPTFTVSRVYENEAGLRLAHYDFYRLQDAGILAAELDESMHDGQTVTVVEWADIVQGVLPDDRLTIRIQATGDTVRHMQLTAGGARSQEIMAELSS